MSIEAVIFSKKILYHSVKNKEGGSSRDSLFYFSYFTDDDRVSIFKIIFHVPFIYI